MQPRINLQGQRYGRLTVVERIGRSRVLCACDCGNKKDVAIGMLRSGRTASCGCLRSQMMREKKITHGKTNSPEYTAYQNAKNRCRRQADARFDKYGGRGIEFRFGGFEEFFEHIGPRPDGHSLDRIDPNGHYEKGNVRWAQIEQQARNKTTTRMVEIDGVTMPLKTACERFGVPYKRAYERIVYAGWSADRAFADDGQVAQITARKVWGLTAQTVVHVEPMGAVE